MSGRHRLARTMGLLLLVLVCLRDGFFHFDRDLVVLKKQHSSPQKHWSLFYDQSHVYLSGSLNISNDLIDLREYVKEDSLVLSDKATSYYFTAHLPVHIVNIHRHHGRYKRSGWGKYLDTGRQCRLSDTKNLHSLLELAKNHTMTYGRDVLLVVNKSQNNVNHLKDCLSTNRGYLIKTADGLFPSLFENESFVLYSLSAGSPDHDKKRSQ